MAAFSDYLEQGLLNFLLRGQALTQPTSIWLALFTADPTDANLTGNELTDAGYQRQDMANGGAISSGWAAPIESGTSHIVTNALAIEFPPIESGSVTVSHFGIYDDPTTGNLLFHGAFDVARALENDDIVALAVGALTIGLE